MTHVTQIHVNRLVPELSVFELAVAMAISRPALNGDDQIRAVVSDWFLQDVRVRDIEQTLEAMVSRGLAFPGGKGLGSYRLTDDGIKSVTILYGGCIRMIDRVPAHFSLLNSVREPGHA